MTTTSGTSNMRPSQRQTRTNPTRTSKTVGSSLRQNPLTSNPPVTAPNAPEHGFYPAITHFTDAITSLPREFRRHTSLLKEVDAKAWAPEAHLQTLLAACVASKPPSSLLSEVQSTADPTAAASDPSIQPVNADGTAHPAADNASQISAPSVNELQSFEHRRLFYNLRSTLPEMMISMDEKNHLIYGANEDLSRQLKRLTAIYPHIADEVSEEARLGSLTHWAYIDNKPPARVNVATSRKEAAAGLAAMHDTDIASRSESRREAMLARKQRQNHLDSDFDDPRLTKRANINGKLRKVGEAVESVSGLGISGAAAPPMKRKRVEKPATAATAAGAVAMERSLSGVVGGRALSREPSLQEGTKKRKAPTAATAAARKRHDCLPVPERGIILTLSRINTANSATNSPKLASSPLLGSFGKEPHRNSPVPGNGRPHSSRVRQNSTQTRPPSSASNKNNRNGIGVSGSTPELHNLSAMTGKSTEEIKSTIKESVNNKGPRLIEEGEDASINGTNGMKAGILLERSASKGGAVSLKREEACASDENSPKGKAAASPRLPPPTLLNTEHSTRPEREREPRVSRARSSKTSTPVINTFAESESTTRDHHSRADNKSKRPSSSSFRSARSKDSLHDSLSPSGLPPKRSHKKGAGLAAQAAVLQAKLAKQQSSNSSGQKADTPASSTSSPPAVAAGENHHHHHRHHNPSAPSPPVHTSSLEHSDTLPANDLPGSEPNHISEEEVDSSGEEPRYCYCQQVSYGEMVACDADNCPREWFHLECVGLGRAPGRNARWFCEECKERLRLGGSGGGGSNGVTALGQTVRRGR